MVWIQRSAAGGWRVWEDEAGGGEVGSVTALTSTGALSL